ncbi:MAG: hypothetical protein DBX61_01375 [Clostridiales bacterium]|nr:MAG: hypothetical protein DBX61_01375 [Clostridiales bacterium]
MGEKKFNREWVKTFAIIFLAVLLVLTFFSNTIMNMTLPEVSTEYIQYGTIKTQVRGSGTVESQDNYSVTFPATREVLQVAVRQGDTVNKGDVLFYLSESESEELQAAREAYDNLYYEYTKMLIDSSTGDDFADKKLAITQLEEDLEKAKQKLAAYADTQSAIEKAKLDVRAAEKAVTLKQNEITELENEKTAIGYTPTEDEVLTGKESDVTYEQYASASKQLEAADKKIDTAKAELTKLQAQMNTAKNSYDVIKRKYDELSAKIEKPLATLEEEIKTSDRNIESLDHDIKYLKQDFYNATSNSELERLYDTFKSKQSAYRKAKNKLDALLESETATEEEIAAARNEYNQAAYAMDDAFEAYDALLTQEEAVTEDIEKQLAAKETELKYALEDNTALKEQLTETKELDAQLNDIKDDLDSAEKTYNDATDKANAAQTVYDNAVAEKEILEKDLEKVRNGYKYVIYKEYEDKIETEKTNLENLNIELDNKKEVLTDLEAQGSDSQETLEEQVNTLERQILTATRELETAIADAGDQDKLQALDIEKKKKELEKAAEEITKLEEKYTASEIVAPVSGVIDSINITSGQKTEPDATLCEISLAEKGFKMTMTVTQEQAAKLRMGSPAEITSYIQYGSTITATLAAIKNDTANPGSRQKILEFTVEGDVTPGQSLSIAVGDKNASYDSTVPNTAIREDSDGKYILVVESKNTPISTRYIAKRVDVTVVASDETRSAITGDFSNYAYVIATSSGPINSGEQVKLIES